MCPFFRPKELEINSGNNYILYHIIGIVQKSDVSVMRTGPIYRKIMMPLHFIVSLLFLEQPVVILVVPMNSILTKNSHAKMFDAEFRSEMSPISTNLAVLPTNYIYVFNNTPFAVLIFNCN